MQGEIPQFKRCCFCLPLRRGLIAWGYAKLICDLLMLIWLIYETFIMYLILSRRFWISKTDIAICSVFALFILIDMSINIVFIIGGHKKSFKLLKVAYVYNMVGLGLLLLVNCFLLYDSLSRVYWCWKYGYSFVYPLFHIIFSVSLFISSLFVQSYLILLIRSEMRKLQNQTLGMQFSNHLTGKPHCTLQNNELELGTQHMDEEPQRVPDCMDKKQDV